MEDWRIRRRGQIAYYNRVSHSAVFFSLCNNRQYIFPWMHVFTPFLLQYTTININLAMCTNNHTLFLLYTLLVLLRELSDYTHTGISLHGAA